jgi:hypothetical protein
MQKLQQKRTEENEMALYKVSKSSCMYFSKGLHLKKEEKRQKEMTSFKVFFYLFPERPSLPI